MFIRSRCLFNIGVQKIYKNLGEFICFGLLIAQSGLIDRLMVFITTETLIRTCQ